MVIAREMILMKFLFSAAGDPAATSKAQSGAKNWQAAEKSFYGSTVGS
jgi:hypothetical protein